MVRVVILVLALSGVALGWLGTATPLAPGSAALEVPLRALPEPEAVPEAETPHQVAPEALPDEPVSRGDEPVVGSEVTEAEPSVNLGPIAPDRLDTVSEVACDLPPPPPLPMRGMPGAAEFWMEFRRPLPRVPLWNPSGPKRVGLQVGHWRLEEVPAELGRLQHGASGGGKQEWEVNLDIAQRTKALLESARVQVDLLPATVPPRYRAHAFLAIHADGDPQAVARGFKLARPAFSSIPEVDDELVEALYAAYGPAAGLPRDDEHITRRMLYYYAFNSRRYCHAVAPGVPQAIIETGFLTSAADRRLLLGNPDAAARGIAEGLLAFLNRPQGELSGP